MKVLHLISGGDKGGAKTHVFALLSALMEEIDVRVVCFMEGVFYQEVQKTDIPHLLIRQRYRNDLTVIGKLIQHIRKERYDIIHAHGARANFIAVALRGSIKIPMITTVHSDYKLDFTDGFYKRTLFTALNSISLRYLDYYIGVSESFKTMLAERGFDADKIYTVYNAVDFEKEITFSPREEFLSRYNIDGSGKIIIGIAGRLDHVKGHEIFIRAAAEIVKKRKDVLFLLAGEGPEQNALETLAKNLKIQDHIIFLGFVTDIFSFINAIDINACSSYSESFPYMLLEGALLKKPTVSTAVGGIPDLILDGETGLLTKSGDPTGLAEKIMSLMNDPEYGEVLGQHLYSYAREKFSSASMKNRHLEIYRDVVRRQKEANKLFDVMLSGYYGFNNSGDDAILSAIIQSLTKEKPDIKILALSKNPRETSAQHGIFSINRGNFFNIFRYMKHCRLFLNGGGSVIQDITSTRSLFYYTTLMHFAKRYGLKVMLYANGIGPIIRDYNMRMAIHALNICDYITLRDPESLAELKRFGITNKSVQLSIDPTLVINPVKDERLSEILLAENIDLTVGKKYFAVSVRQWKYSDSNFVTKTARFVNELSRRYGLTPVFVPMQIPYDIIISREIVSKLEQPAIILGTNYNVREMMGILGKMELVVGMRLHTLIYAVSMGVPIIGIVYDPKVRAFMEYVGQTYYTKCKNLDADKMLEMASYILDNYDSVKQEIGQECAKLRMRSVNDAKIAVSLI